ncbi:hypothetical protein U0038_14870 [Sphingobacterium spiritivorum]|uniref:immunoglobulin domain-containing protein n=2 Tax=Sphingobacterium spiritivorum TaxID=258 RepID=UPI000E00C33F|nr:hypothetical protein [Sphingobacterium spiritivorum]QQT36066.1 hypothetical protein I6J01_01170 [Sphingobacterium spiritivorum]WQD32798.1 hypothetical protein U0038_14870 [Sphingobacterium spiritivorum]SUJ14954.1 Uncharacterised protein [Sphingobacterium spiritivorum]
MKLKWCYLICMLALLFYGMAGTAYAQRVYANSFNSSTDVDLGCVLVVCGSVNNGGNAVSPTQIAANNPSTIVSPLVLSATMQNVRFTGANALPSYVTPVMVKLKMNASLLSLINSISLQRTNGNVSTPVGTEYSAGYLLDLLGIGGVGQQELTVILPVVGSAQANDGIRVKVGSAVSLGLSASLYYAYYIIPPTVTSATLNLCGNVAGSFTISNFQSGYTYKLYTAAVDGTEVSGVSTTTNTLAIPGTLAAGTYYLEARETNTYPSARTPVTIVRSTLPDAPTIPNVTTCAGTSATLTVSSPVAGISYRWYTAASGGTALTTANSYTISNPTTTTTYYVEGYNATTGCISASRTAVTLTVNPLPAAPTIPNVTTCAGTSATLTVSSPVAGISYRWYTAASGGTVLTTANSYTISNPTTTITYYVEGYNATTGCISASRTAVTLTVNPLPAAPTIPNVTTCAGTSATLTVSSPVAGISYRWYTAASGGTVLTTANSYTISNPTTTTTYYVEGYNATTGCISASRTAVTLTVNPLPAAPAIPNVTTCAGTSATLTISSPVGGTTYNWYTVSTGGTSVNTGPTYTISNPATTTTYYVEAVSAGCISASRTAVTLTVNPLPAAPTIPNVTTCAGTSATLTVSSPVAGISYRWYTAASGGTALTTANSYTISNPTTTTTYYVEGYNATTGCISASRTAVTLTVNPLPAAPTIPNVTTCAGTSATLTISSPVGGTTYNWYTVSTGGTSVNTGPTYTISNPATTTTYYVEAVSAGCISASRTAVTLTVNPLPAAPTVPGKATCIGTSTTLSVSSPVAGATYRWYTTSTGGTSFFTGTDYTITNPAVTVTYYVEASNAGCVSTSRTAVTLTVNPLPVAPTVPNTATCSGTSVLLSVSSPVAGIIYRWYTSAGGGTVLNTGTNYIISNPTVTTTYYVEAFNETTGCTSLTRTAVTLTINPLPSVTLSPSPRICEGDLNASLPFVVANGGNQYKITWDPGTPVSFQNVTNWTNLTGNSITVSVPGNASYGVYTGKVSIYNSVNGCEGSLQSFSINIYPAQGKTHLTIQNIIN